MEKLFCRILLLVLACSILASCSSGQAANRVSVASKTFTESVLLSEIYAQLIENKTDIEVERKQEIGGTPVCYTEMKNGEVDIYVEYTGTLYNEILKLQYDPNIGADEIYAVVKKEMNDTQSIAVLSPIGFNNTFAIAMQKDKADALGIKTISDLSPLTPRLIFAADSLYYTRVNDGYEALVSMYGMDFKSAVKMDAFAMYEAVNQGQVDAIMVYATDSLLKKYNMTILKDDKKMFPDYRSVPIVRNQTLAKYPELSKVLDLLAGRVDDERMQRLNYLVDVEDKRIDEVANEFLTDEGLLE